MKSQIRAGVLLIGILSGSAELHAREAASELTSPASVGNQLANDKQKAQEMPAGGSSARWHAFKSRVRESTGLDFGVDYNVLGFSPTNSEGDDSAVSGVLRFFGEWELANKGSPDSGSLVYKVEHRHAYTDFAPGAFGGELGYLGVPGLGFSDQGTRVTHLFWKQKFAGGRGVSYIGFLDVTDYADVYALASPWTGFANLVFGNGSGTIGGSPDGALGAMIGGFLDDNVYLVAGIADANGDPTDVFDGFNTLFDNGETFKSLEIGWTTGAEDLFVNNAHVTLWQIDARQDAGTPDGHGVSVSLSGRVGKDFLPFLRGGWAKDGGAMYDGSISAGFGYSSNPRRRVLGLGLNWSSPNPSTYGPGLRVQTTVELFQLVHLTENIEITPSLQYIHNPSFASEYNSTVLLGLRLRVSY